MNKEIEKKEKIEACVLCGKPTPYPYNNTN